MAKLAYGALTHMGNVRKNNEDALLADADLGLWLVADGMGGHEAGEVASDIVRHTIASQVKDGQSLKTAIQASHKAVLAGVSQGQGARGMGSTVVASHDHGTYIDVAWVGDSRVYLWSRPSAARAQGELRQLTTDHSYVQALLESGAITEAEMDNHPDRNVITQCLGSLDLAEVRVDVVEHHWQPDEWLVLCSDGLTDEVPDSEIRDTLNTATSPEDAAKRLLDKALANGGRDNTTVIVLEGPYSSSPSTLSLPVLVFGLLLAIILLLVLIG